MSRIERELDELRRAMGMAVMRRKPACDIIDERDKITVLIDLPGFTKNDIDVEIGENYVKVRAERKERENKNYMLQERVTNFYRFIELPVAVKEEGAKAKFRNGVLEITLPKREGRKGKKIKIE